MASEPQPRNAGPLERFVLGLAFLAGLPGSVIALVLLAGLNQTGAARVRVLRFLGNKTLIAHFKFFDRLIRSDSFRGERRVREQGQQQDCCNFE